MEKRLRKLSEVTIENSVDLDGPIESDLLIIGWGSSRGVIDEARERLEGGAKVTSHAHVRVLMPFPTAELAPSVAKAKKIVVVENNGTGQLAGLVKQHLACADKMETLLKYNGEPFYPNEIEAKLKELVAWQPLKTSVTI